jgi:hypothetical protein
VRPQTCHTTIALIPTGEGGFFEEVQCDPCFAKAVSIAKSQAADLKKQVVDLSDNQRRNVTRLRIH